MSTTTSAFSRQFAANLPEITTLHNRAGGPFKNVTVSKILYLTCVSLLVTFFPKLLTAEVIHPPWFFVLWPHRAPRIEHHARQMQRAARTPRDRTH
jgi:hypothetical protein